MKVVRARGSGLVTCSSALLGLGVSLSASMGLAQQPEEADSTRGSVSLDGDAPSESGAEAEAEAEAAPPSEEVTTAADATAADASADDSMSQDAYPYAGARAKPGHGDPRTYVTKEPYITRYRPEGNLWEIGLFGGALFPSSKHNIKVPELPHSEYSTAAGEFGARAAYFPLSFLGVEIEGFAAGGATQNLGYSAMLYSLRAHAVVQLPLYSIVPFLVVGGGTLGGISEEMGHDRDPAFEFGGGVKVPFNRRVSARIDGRDTMTQKTGAKNGKQTHHPEVHLGLTFTFERTQALSKLPPDTDYDGLFDSEDKCPTVGALTIDGCPGDSDGDGFSDDVDECPKDAGVAPAGCPDLDEDGDGVPIPADQCPAEQGPEPTGCPDRDEDGDGFIGDDDKCPKAPETRNGFEDDDGCPDEMPEAIKRFTGVIQGINFKVGTAEIEKTSLPTLDAAIEILKMHPSIRIEISGHTSSEGTEQRNQELSEQRANAVRNYFVEKGVAEDRIIARGAGPSEPIADNATRQGRQQNRRIEFRILSQP